MERVEEISKLEARLQRLARGMRAAERLQRTETEIEAAYHRVGCDGLGQALIERNAARAETGDCSNGGRLYQDMGALYPLWQHVGREVRSPRWLMFTFWRSSRASG